MCFTEVYEAQVYNLFGKPKVVIASGAFPRVKSISFVRSMKALNHALGRSVYILNTSVHWHSLFSIHVLFIQFQPECNKCEAQRSFISILFSSNVQMKTNERLYFKCTQSDSKHGSMPVCFEQSLY